MHPTELEESVSKVNSLKERLCGQWVGKDETIRLLVLSLVAGEHLLIVGPPGTAKSALVRSLAEGLSARYFEYLLTRFSEPSELLGPIDIGAFREGFFRRKTEQMLPDAEVVFLDELFKASSAILNSLLGLLGERQVLIGAERLRCPLLSLFAASNEIPADDDLTALLDRFLLRVRTDNLPSFQFSLLVEKGLLFEKQKLSGIDHRPDLASPVGVQDILRLRQALAAGLVFSDDFLQKYQTLVGQIRGEGVFLSDRRLIKLLKLMQVSALLSGRRQAEVPDLFVLKHTWNSVQQAELLTNLVDPVLREYTPRQASENTKELELLLEELARLQTALQRAGELSDMQLFAKLRALGELRYALWQHEGQAAQEALRKLDSLLDSLLTQTPLLL